MFSLSVLLCVTLLFVNVYSETTSDDKNLNDDVNKQSVVIPSYNDINRGERMTISIPVPVLKTTPSQFVRQMVPVHHSDPNTFGTNNANNNPTALYYYEYCRQYPSQIHHQRHVITPNIVYKPIETTANSFRNSERTNSINKMRPAIVQPYNQQHMSYPQKLNMDVPPGLPLKTIAKLEKLLNTINKSLVSVCQNTKSSSASTNTDEENVQLVVKEPNKQTPPQQQQQPLDEFQNQRYEKWIERNMIIKNEMVDRGEERNERLMAVENEKEVPLRIEGGKYSG